MDPIAGPSRLPAIDLRDAPVLPPEAPLEMTARSLWTPSTPRRFDPAPQRGTGLRRLGLMGGTIFLTCVAAAEMHAVLKVGGLTDLEWVVLALFVTLFAWIAFSFVTALAGFLVLLFGQRRWLGIDPAAPLPSLAARTALLMPTYNEDPVRVMAGLQAIHDSLHETGQADRFDLFVLSDTTDPDIWVAEEAAFLGLRERTGNGRLFYRRRPKNIERKAGNIADWVRRFGAAYPQMIILDADSLMTGDTIVRIAAAMERHPGVGLIQTLPVVVNGNTLFARLQQFAGRIYGPLLTHGLAWWYGSESNYWGHNAIIRTQAFADCAGLPVLRGRRPFGGHIMSHDFIEAAFIRRGGWAVHIVPQLAGSYEEIPPSLTDLALRDRRWCQGNLQHIAILPARGLHWISRLHLLIGIGAYITAPLWLLFLTVGTLISLQAQFIRPEYFSREFSLFPQWPAQDPVRAAWVFVATMAVLLAPKLMSFVLVASRPRERQACGGGFRLFASVLIETVISGLVAPILMMIQSGAVIEILLGRDAGWPVQRRDDGSVPFSQIVRRYSLITAAGIATAIAVYFVSVPLLFWMAPILVGLLLAIPIAALTARRGLGVALRRLGLLRIPEESEPPPILLRARALMQAMAISADIPIEAIARLAADPRLLNAHIAMLPQPRRPGEGPIDVNLLMGSAKLAEAVDLPSLLTTLTRPEKAAILADAKALSMLMDLAQNPSTSPQPSRAPANS